MKDGPLFSPRRRLLPALACLALAAAAPPAAPAQEAQPTNWEQVYAEMRAIKTPQKVDEFQGRLGHCDLTARYDNLAIYVQNMPGSKALLVGRNPTGSNVDHVTWHLKRAFYYLTESRGLAPERVVVVNAGSVEGKEMLTELWVVPEGAEPPVRPPDDAPAKEFSGLLEGYQTDENTFREEVEMGWPSYAVSFSDFAEKLRRQPESQGYLVVRPSKTSLPGAWSRIARRDEFILQQDYKVEAGRIKSINGGPSADDTSRVELWILPKSAPPPAGAKEEAAAQRLAEAAVLNTHESYAAPDKDTQRWTLDNLAEFLRANEKATGVIIVREYVEEETEESAEEEAAAETDAAAAAPPSEGNQTSPADGTSATPAAKQGAASSGNQAAETQAAAGKQTGEPESPEQGEGQDGETAAEGEEEEETPDPLTLAEEWKQTLVEKYGIEPHRVVVLAGHPQGYPWGRIDTWVVPAGKPLPDPFAVTRDEEPAEEEATEEASAESARDETPPPVEFRFLR